MAWRQLPALSPARYHHSLVAVSGSTLLSFGGHLCSQSKGEAPFYYLNTVHALDLSALLGVANTQHSNDLSDGSAWEEAGAEAGRWEL